MSTPRPPDLDPGRGVAERNRKKLLEEFGTALDESLVISIANDRDLAKDYDDIRDVLRQLAEHAPAEAATGFDPSGLGCLTELERLRVDEQTITSGNGFSRDSPTECATTISDFSNHSDNPRFTHQSDFLSDDQKLQDLKLIFQDRFKDHTLRFILKQSGGNFERAFDELINRQHLEETGSLPKGIDGFFTPDGERQPAKEKSGRARKGKAKNKKQTLAVAYKAVSPTTRDEELEGAKDFIPSAGSRAASSPRYLPAAPALTIRTNLPSASSRSGVTSPATPSPSGGSGTENLRAAAAALRRMGPLGRQAAAVYTDRAREKTRAAVAQAAQLADARVARQSTDTTVDLHGVSVLDGVRITRQRVWAWWHGLEPGWNRRTASATKAGGGGFFTVVTGLGKHNAGGVSRLRQAVGAFLRNDGWKVETLTGSFYVTGRV